MGRVELKKEHVLTRCTGKFRISERLQGLMCLVGQSVVFEEGSKLMNKMLGIDLSAPQIQRVCIYYGQSLDWLIRSNCEAVLPKIKTTRTDDIAYVMMDGSMIYTREDEWKEMKLGRIFYDSQIIDIQSNRREIYHSLYVSHLGSVDRFFPKLERYLTPYKKKVILGDGARWIWKWAEDNYPGATQIVDFYHAQEKLVIFAKHQFIQDHKRKNWIADQKAYLLNNQVERVIDELSKIKARNTEAKHAKQKAIDYYLEHEDRMQYKTYKEKGLLIGSGPIEAAHRSVIHQRMKLSGQKWTIKGAQAIANLRCYEKSNAWNIITNIIAAAA